MPPQIPEPIYEQDIDKLIRQYRRALKEIRLELESMASLESDISKANIASAMDSITARLRQLDENSETWLKRNVPVAAKDGAMSALISLGVVQSMDEARKIAKFNQLNERMVEAVIADTQQDLLAVTNNVERRVRNAIRSHTADVMRRNMAKGINGRQTNRREILTELRNKLGSALDTGIIDAAGRRWKPDTYIDMVVRTKMMYANNEATMNEAIDRGVNYVRVSSHGATDACRNWEGKILKITAEAKGSYPTVADARASRDIFHPNCKHVLTPIRNPDGILDAQKSQGQTAAQKLESALYPLEDKIKSRATEKGFVYSPDGAKLWEQSGSVNQVDISDAVHKNLLKGNVLTHNHPRGTSFSPADIQVMLQYGLTEIRAVGSKYVYSAKPPKDYVHNRENYDRLERAREAAEDDVKSEFWEKIQSGRMSYADADMNHFHQVWTRVAEREGLIYERSEWKDRKEPTGGGAGKGNPR